MDDRAHSKSLFVYHMKAGDYETGSGGAHVSYHSSSSLAIYSPLRCPETAPAANGESSAAMFAPGGASPYEVYGSAPPLPAAATQEGRVPLRVDE